MRRLPTLILALLGAALLSQAPEFAQQYRQRLGGALDELRVVVADFARDAANASLSRDDAVGRMRTSADGFVRDRGSSMQATIERFERLEAQAARLEAAPPAWRPAVVARGADRRILAAAWEAFEPAVPLTTAGLVWAFLGGGLLGAGGMGARGLMRAGAGVARRMGRRKAVPHRADPRLPKPARNP